MLLFTLIHLTSSYSFDKTKESQSPICSWLFCALVDTASDVDNCLYSTDLPHISEVNGCYGCMITLVIACSHELHTGILNILFQKLDLLT